DQIAQVQNAWPDLIGRVSSAVENGTDPTSEAGRALGREWQELLAQFHRGDEDLRESLFAMQADNAEQIRREHGGPSPEQLDFIRRATALLACSGGSEVTISLPRGLCASRPPAYRVRMTEENEETTSGARERSSVPWIVIGMVIGVGIGIALDNIATGIGIG